MTIHDDFDELAAAYLDGEATAEEIARVESDPELLAIVEEFRLLAGGVGAPVDLPDEATRERQIQNALAALDVDETSDRNERGDHDSSDHDNNVASLADARYRRAERQRRFLSIAAVIAAVAVGGALIWAIARGGTSDTAMDIVDTTTESSADAASDAAEDVMDSAMDEDAAEEDAMEEAFDDDDAMAGDAMADEAMDEEEAMEEEAAEEAVVEAEAEAVTDDEARLGDDDAAEQAADSETTAGSATAPADLDALVEDSRETGDNSTGESSSADDSAADGDADGGDDADAATGLFELPFEERSDFLGLFASTDEIAEAALTAPPSSEPSPLGGDGCASVAGRLALADTLVLIGTGQIIDDVTGQPVNLAIWLLEAAGTQHPLAVDVDECRIYLGADNLP